MKSEGAKDELAASNPGCTLKVFFAFPLFETIVSSQWWLLLQVLIGLISPPQDSGLDSCPVGWSRWGGRCFFFSVGLLEDRRWNESAAFCRQHSSSLAVIRDADEMVSKLRLGKVCRLDQIDKHCESKSLKTQVIRDYILGLHTRGLSPFISLKQRRTLEWKHNLETVSVPSSSSGLHPDCDEEFLPDALPVAGPDGRPAGGPLAVAGWVGPPAPHAVSPPRLPHSEFVMSS